MHLWPSLRIRDSFKHAYLQKLEFNLAHMKRAQRQGQDQDQQQPPGDGKAPLLEGRSPSSRRGSMVAGALELAWDAAMLLTCCCCCFCCGGWMQSQEARKPIHQTHMGNSRCRL